MRSTIVKVTGGLVAGVVLASLFAARQTPSTAAPAAAAESPAARPQLAHAQAVQTWSATAGPLAYTIGANLQRIGAAASRQDIAGMVEGCRTLRRNVRRLRTELPAPDSALNAALTAAVTEFLEAADNCIRGGTSLRSADIERATTHLMAGGRHITRATTRLQELGRSVREPE
jgi:hypothetical protein